MRMLSNLLTASRLVLLAPIILLLSYGEGPWARWFAFGIFIVAALTDGLIG